MFGKCNCGREGRYILLNDKGESVDSCNKYSLCKTYEELESLNKRYLADILTALSSAQDIISFRESSEFYKGAEYQIKTLSDKYKFVQEK